MNLNLKKYQKYLPSKIFIFFSLGTIILTGIVLLVIFVFPKLEIFKTDPKKENSSLNIGDQSILSLIQNDTDKDGVADWEEALWGTDKNKKISFGDTPDATYIENKKKELNIEQIGNTNQNNLTETEKFAREFFTSYSAMKTSGQIDKETINSFSNALGQEVVNSEIENKYSEKNIKIEDTDTVSDRRDYYLKMKKLFDVYKTTGLGDELQIVSSGAISGNDFDSTNEQYLKLIKISEAYQNFALKTSEISTPKSLVSYSLQIINSANNTGISIQNMSKISKDPIVGLSGLSQYQKYSEMLVKAVAELENTLAGAR